MNALPLYIRFPSKAQYRSTPAGGRGVAQPYFVQRTLRSVGFSSLVKADDSITGGAGDYARYASSMLLRGETMDNSFVSNPGLMNLNLGAPQWDSPIGGWRFSADRQGMSHPQGLRELRELITGQASTEQVIVQPGASGALATALRSFVNSGESVVLFDPCSPMFRRSCASIGARVRWVPTWHEAGRTRFLFDGLARAMSGARMIVLAEPNNPTGGTFLREDLEHLAWLAKRHDVLVVCDQSFNRFRYDVAAVQLDELTDFTRRWILLGSVTASLGLGSLRVGWAAGAAPLVHMMTRCAQLTGTTVPTACQQAALRALQAEREQTLSMQEQFRSKRRYTLDRLGGMGLVASVPNAGFTCWVNVADVCESSRKFAAELLAEEQVLVGCGSDFSPNGEQFIRVSFAVEDGRLREGLTRLGRFIRRKRGDPTVIDATVQVEQPTVAESDAVPQFSRV
jgi:aspartate/methionine/tyrosine aminotransferase